MVRAVDRAARAARASVWLSDGKDGPTARTRRSDQPSGLDRERITRATVRLLDEEGLPKFSMRRLAGSLDVTAMSVYWYVDTKEDLLELALDAVMGEVAAPAEEDGSEDEGAEGPGEGPGEGSGEGSGGGDWRGRLRELASGYRAMLVRHPWVSPLMGSYLNIGPCSQAFSRRLRAVLGDTGLSPAEQMGALSAVFRFVYGFGTIEGHVVRRCAAAGMSQDEYYRDALGSMARRPEFVESFGSTQEIFGASELGGVEDMRERDFSFALELLVAGVEAMGRRREG